MTMNNPYPSSKFAIDGEDIRIEGLNESIEFALQVGGSIVLRETYNYDNEGCVTIRGIAGLISKALYGTLDTGIQQHAQGEVDFYIDSVSQASKTLYASRLKNPRDPDGQKQVLAVAEQTVCYPGKPFYVSVIGRKSVDLVRQDSTIIAGTHIGTGSDEDLRVTTADCDPRQLFPNHWDKAARMIIGDELEVDLLPEACREAVSVRFLNRYDVMESLTAMYMTEKPTVQDDVSLMGGRRTRFSVKSNTDYTLFSGRLNSQEEFDTWQDLLTSRKAQIYWKDQWVDIIITKGNYTRQRRQFYGSQVEISFQTAGGRRSGDRVASRGGEA